jgi:hypothetical protein
MNPTPTKPRTIIAQVADSGTAGATPAISTRTCSTELRLPALVKPSELKVSPPMAETRMKFSPFGPIVCIAPEVMGAKPSAGRRRRSRCGTRHPARHGGRDHGARSQSGVVGDSIWRHQAANAAQVRPERPGQSSPGRTKDVEQIESSCRNHSKVEFRKTVADICTRSRMEAESLGHHGQIVTQR